MNVSPIAIAVALATQFTAISSGSASLVRVIVTDGWGTPIKQASIQFMALGGWNGTSTLEYKKADQISLSPGRYAVSVTANGFRSLVQVVDIAGENVFLPLTLALADIETPQPDPLPILIGRIGKVFLTTSPHWIRVVSIHNGLTKSAEIESSGAFLIRDLMPGRYMLFVMNGGELVHSRLIDVRRISREVVVNP